MKLNRKLAGAMGVTIMTLSVTACGQAATPSSNTKNSTATTSNTAKSSTSNTPATNNTSSNTSSTNTSGNTPPATTVSNLYNGPLPGNLLIADRGNGRILIVTPDKKIIWSMQISHSGPHNANSLGADDSFFTPDYKHIIINEEDNQQIDIIDIATKKIIWSYGHAGVFGSAPGYLHTPDDAYQLANGNVTVADIKNERILTINPAGQIVRQYGTTGRWYHNPPYSFAAPNGDTPLPDGGMMVTEIGARGADRLDKNGKLLYTVHFKDILYPSDTQLLKNGNLLVADYSKPGRIEEVTPQGQVVWDYYKTSGPGELSQPSLAMALPNGDIACNDDANDRVVIIDPKTNQIVWQYGYKGVPGTAPGYLNVPDGMDFLPPNISLPGVNN